MRKCFLSIVHDEIDACGILLLNIVGARFHQPGCRLKLLCIAEITGLRADQQVDLYIKSTVTSYAHHASLYDKVYPNICQCIV